MFSSLQPYHKYQSDAFCVKYSHSFHLRNSRLLNKLHEPVNPHNVTHLKSYSRCWKMHRFAQGNFFLMPSYWIEFQLNTRTIKITKTLIVLTGKLLGGTYKLKVMTGWNKVNYSMSVATESYRGPVSRKLMLYCSLLQAKK